jgi:hypothetical protein
MITPKDISQIPDGSGFRYALVRYWREMVEKANGHLIQWRLNGTDTGAVGQVNKVDFVGAGVSTAVVDETLTVTIAGGGGGGVSDGDKGDIVVSGGGAVYTVDADAVTYAKMQNVSAASRLLGRGQGAGAGDVQELTLGAGLGMTGTVLSASPTWTSITANLPSGAGVFEHEQTVTDATVTASSRILLQLDVGLDTDENQAEGITLASMQAYPAAGSFVLNMQFPELHSGPIKLSYQVN